MLVRGSFNGHSVTLKMPMFYGQDEANLSMDKFFYGSCTVFKLSLYSHNCGETMFSDKAMLMMKFEVFRCVIYQFESFWKECRKNK